jgi:hypothetical protein
VVKSSSGGSRNFFRWSGKKMSKSHANVAVLTQQDSIISQDQSTCSSVGDVDIAAFQRELINLPTFVMDTPPVDVSPVFSRCSSVPENLTGRNRSSSALGGSSGKLDAFAVDADSPEHTMAATARFVLSGGLNSSGDTLGEDSLCSSDALVRITTTDADDIDKHKPKRRRRKHIQHIQQTETDIDSPAGAELTNIVVHFEAPSSPQPSTTSSQSPEGTTFQFPAIPPPPPPSTITAAATLPTSTTTSVVAPLQPPLVSATTPSGTVINTNFLSPHQEYGFSSYGLPGPTSTSSTAHSPASTSSTNTALHSPLATVSERTSTHTLKGSVVATPCDIPVQHRGVLKVREPVVVLHLFYHYICPNGLCLEQPVCFSSCAAHYLIKQSVLNGCHI